MSDLVPGPERILATGATMVNRSAMAVPAIMVIKKIRKIE
jgi:hypothetical protein